MSGSLPTLATNFCRDSWATGQCLLPAIASRTTRRRERPVYSSFVPDVPRPLNAPGITPETAAQIAAMQNAAIASAVSRSDGRTRPRVDRGHPSPSAHHLARCGRQRRHHVHRLSRTHGSSAARAARMRASRVARKAYVLPRSFCLASASANSWSSGVQPRGFSCLMRSGLMPGRPSRGFSGSCWPPNSRSNSSFE
jgi:hypothetical protein